MTNSNEPGNSCPLMPSPRWSATTRTVFFAFCAIVAALFIYEHRMHVLGWLPYLILLACPLMHLFMHHGHGHNHGGPNPPSQPEKERDNG